MAEIFKKSYNVKLPKAQHEVEEFSAKKGLVLCRDCGAAYYKKHWHHGLEKLNNAETAGLSKESQKSASVKFMLCPACQMIANKQYEGRIIIKNVPEEFADELAKLIANFCRRAYDRDPMDRLIAIQRNKNTWEITLTENQLANKLTHKIKDVFKKVVAGVKFSQEPGDAAEAVIECRLP